MTPVNTKVAMGCYIAIILVSCRSTQGQGQSIGVI